MQKILHSFLILIFFSPILLSAQFDCTDGRFDNPEYFSAVEITEDIQFGENVNPTIVDPNLIQELFFDVYEPVGDTTSFRPVIFWAFGGSFVAGSRKSPDIVELCERYAKAGYVTIAIDYRLSVNLIWEGNQENAYLATMKATHDMKAAVRYIRKNIEEDNTYRIHPNHLYVGGVSAGAFAALHTAYLDDDAEIPTEIIEDSEAFGGAEGLSGTPGYSSEVNGVINLCGALGDTTYLEAGNVPVVSMHGTDDTVVPYGSEIVTTLNINTLIHGSASIHHRALELGINSQLKTWFGEGHVPFGNSATYMDSTFNFTKDFLLDLVCNPTVGTDDNYFADHDVKVSPNPTTSDFTVELNDKFSGSSFYQLTDLNGKVLQEQYINTHTFRINRGNLTSGMYLLRLVNENHQLVKKIVFQ